MSKVNPSRSAPSKVSLWLLVGLLVFVLAVWYAYGRYVTELHPKLDRRGLYGDSFGGANALFSAFAFAGLIYTIMLQRAELALQREELAETRAVMERQEHQLAAQNATLQKQALENTFFQLLRLHTDLTNSVVSDRDGVLYTGRLAFRQAIEDFAARYRSYAAKDDGRSENELIDTAYEEAFQHPNAEFGHYFRNLYRIVQFIDGSDVADKRLYTGLVRAQLSRPEQLGLFYNCLAKPGRMKFKPLVEKYALLENMNPHPIMVSHLGMYAEGARGSKDQ
jgi:hypothetical protein